MLTVILGLVLFFLFINDLVLQFDNATTMDNADDSTLLYLRLVNVHEGAICTRDFK
jgi:hypothetical protein